MGFRLSLGVCASCLITLVVAAKAAERTPWLIGGKAVPLSCLAALDDSDVKRHQRVDIAKCHGVPPDTVADGKTGFINREEHSYFYYSHLGPKDGSDLLFVETSGGGSGLFSEIIGIKRTGNILQYARNYAGGDRCNGGISSAKLANGQLSYDVSLTPSDLILMGDKNAKFRPYQDLAAGAMNCVADLHMRDETVMGVTLTERDLPATGGSGETYQACFNDFYRRAVIQGGAEMNVAQLQAFAKGFVRTCIVKTR